MFYHNRGMYLESLINYTIEKYNQQQKAIIFKTRPQIIKLSNSEQFFNFATIDYHGLFKGKFICFEAKTTKKTVLAWSNIKSHQWNFLKLVYESGGISFIIIYFESTDLYFLVMFKTILQIKAAGANISIATITKNGYQINLKYPFLLDFLPFIQI